ncbi:hypothetical protein CBR_g38988 [Chara braunii]|uniref:Reverse transcriptase domain-containing protein n=1 Tax=Chara braunii TaxID=69332 RepID=A0A388K0X7_CHABU|nr:hypothetical protein CBR_g38988 [Chara braunii]|eukprot:GBG63676.1 hypothetical protein CBR_g38988 [Chara braunii]
MPEPFKHPTVKRELAFLTVRFLICPTDKAPNTPAFVCKNFIRKLALQRPSGPEFDCIPMPHEAIVSRIRGELAAFPALPAAATTLPYLMAVLKAHKGSFRWITNTTNFVISPAADLCACLLRFLLPLVQTYCQDRTREVEEQYGVRPNLWWAISPVGEFYANLPNKVYSVFTADITRCFETIRIDGSEDSLTTAVRFYVHSAMQTKRERTSNHAIVVRFEEGGELRPTWADAGQPEEMGSLLFKEGDICWLSEWCIANSIVCMGEYAWRQVRGIPMGLACSPILCDIYFFKYEYQAMMRLVDTRNAHLIPYFEGTFRYVDDLGAVNNAVIKSFLEKGEDRLPDDPCWIYPAQYIKIKENTEVDEEGIGRVAKFLSMTITVTSPADGSYSTTRHDMRMGLGFAPCRYIKFRSNRSTRQSLRIITAQVAQILLLCSELEDADNQLAGVVPTMTDNGFAANACWAVVKKALRNAHLYQPGRLSVHVIREALANLHGITY